MDEFTLDVGGDIQPGTYLCVLSNLERFDIVSNGEYETPAGESIPKLRWTFATDEGLMIEGSTSLATGPRSKMRAWMTGIGVDISKPAKLKLSSLIGREAMVTVTLNENGYAGISSVVPAPKPKAAL
jgi:hypothetical protein